MQNKDDSLKGKDQEQSGDHKEKEKEKGKMEGEGNDNDSNKVDERLPPGFRFHPTDEELITYYLVTKISDSSFTGRAIGDVDLNKSEPWDLPGKAKMGEKEWYFFSRRDRKYPTGVRTNRATNTGYWKTTGKDREIYNTVSSELVGMKKTLVFYRGRAPRGEKSNWVMHEYRIHSKSPFRTTKEEWVVCRVFQKSLGVIKKYPPIPMATHQQQQHQHQHQHQHQVMMRANNIPYGLEIGSMQPPMLMHQQLDNLGRNNYMNNAELADLTRSVLLRSSSSGPQPLPQLNTYPNMVGSGFTISGLNLNLGAHHDHIVTPSNNNNNNAPMIHAAYGTADITGGPSNRPYNMSMDNCVDLDGYWPSYN